MFTKLKDSLVNTRRKLKESLFSLFIGIKKIDDSLLIELEKKLLAADIGIHTTKKIIDVFMSRRISMEEIVVPEKIYGTLCEDMVAILSSVDHPLIISEDKKPFIILIVGVNGVGKTSMVGKLAYRYRKAGKTVVLGAADTFRVAALEQLQVLGRESGVSIISQNVSNDPASVVFESVRHAQFNRFDILMIDTAGRLQNKSYLMAELKKLVRVIKKFDMDAPHEIMIVLDATIGQNSVNQVVLFNECIGITGISMSKLDGTSKGGVLFSIVDQFNIPIRYVSFGKNISDVDVFNINDFTKSIFY